MLDKLFERYPNAAAGGLVLITVGPFLLFSLMWFSISQQVSINKDDIRFLVEHSKTSDLAAEKRRKNYMDTNEKMQKSFDEMLMTTAKRIMDNDAIMIANQERILFNQRAIMASQDAILHKQRDTMKKLIEGK